MTTVTCRACGVRFDAGSYAETQGRTCPDCRARAQGFLRALAIATVAFVVFVVVVALVFGAL